MLTVDIPGLGVLGLQYLVLDLNGTIALDGALLPGVATAVHDLGRELRVIVVTADTLGTASALAEELGAEVRIIERGREAEAKRDFVAELGAASVVAIGNGANDVLMLHDAAVGIAVVAGEGAAAVAVAAADVMTGDVSVALGLLQNPARLVATLRR
jgi:P-type E1-E2 ATPase